MHPPGAETVVVRYGDMSTKSSQVRGHMERLLADHVSALLADRDLPGDVEIRPTRPLVHTTPADVEAVAEAAAEAFGVVSTSPALQIPPEREAIEAALADTARAVYDGGSFAIDARRAGELPFDSDDVERFGGNAVGDALRETGVDPPVDLDDPDWTFHVEVREETAFVYLDVVDGPGGLPLGSQAPLVALISGGLDSPVAAYEAMRRGSPVVPVYVQLGDYGGPDHEARAMEVVDRLSKRAPNHDTRLWMVPGGEAVSLLADEMEQGRMLSLRRFMLRAAAEIAREVDAAGIVTGEAIGQKSSQTARNIRVTDAATDLPVHRPLLTVDKNEITERARDLGTFRDSTIPTGCTRIAPSQPETNGRLDRLLASEPDGLMAMAERAASEATVLDPRS